VEPELRLDQVVEPFALMFLPQDRRSTPPSELRTKVCGTKKMPERTVVGSGALVQAPLPVFSAGLPSFGERSPKHGGQRSK
jgi:hypothetical protein